MSLAVKRPYDVDLELIKYTCYSERCNQPVSAWVWPGDRPPRKFCTQCKNKVNEYTPDEGWGGTRERNVR